MATSLTLSAHNFPIIDHRLTVDGCACAAKRGRQSGRDCVNAFVLARLREPSSFALLGWLDVRQKKSSNTQFRFGFRLNVTLIWINGSAKSAEGLGNAIFNGSLGRACWPRPRWQVGISDSSSRGRIKPTMAGNLLWAFRSLSNYASIDSTSQLSWQTIPLRGARTQSNWSDSSEIDARTTWRMVDEAAVRIWARLPISGHKLWAIV